MKVLLWTNHEGFFYGQTMKVSSMDLEVFGFAV